MDTKQKGLSTSFIKTIALICMFIDHFAASVMMQLLYHPNHPIMLQIGKWIQADNIMVTYNFIKNIYEWMRHIGRVSFPIYCFFIVEGFFKTRDRKKYAIRLGICALLSELPFDIALYGKIIYLWHQNVFYTLLIGLLAIWVLDKMAAKTDWSLMKHNVMTLLCTIGFVLVAEVLSTDYSGFGVLTIVLMYYVRRIAETKTTYWPPIVLGAGTAFLCLFSPGEVWAFIGLPLMFFYHGKKGWNGKWFFYLFYPVHLIVLAVIVLCLGLLRIGII
ncbi:MAG: conjugal transfer protein TraX [Lachnospiraceae bacterium]|nr:conjugal transfer protein TraX [Lachnospiraceae bacterium]MBQ7833645.1 conjugal transfer protein TraX [Lachnospiraceae bacterium]